MHVLTWVLAAVLVGVNLHALIVLGVALANRPAGAPRQRLWAIRCAVSGVAAFAFSVVVSGVSILNAFAVKDIEPSERAKHLAMGISDVMNSIVLGVVGLVLPIIAAIVLVVLVRRAPPRP